MFTWDDSEIRAQVARFDAAVDRFPELLKQRVAPKAEFLAQRVRANVPRKTGNLEKHVSVKIVSESSAVGAELVADTAYAVEVHERPGALDGSTPEGGRGPKYFTRVTDFYPNIWEEPIHSALEDTLQGKR